MQKKYIAHNSLLPLYLAWQLEPNNANYHLNFSYQLDNYPAVELLIHKFQDLIRLKAYLRQTFSLENEKLMVTIHDTLQPEVTFYTCTQDDFLNLEKTLIKKPHDINKKSPVKLSIIDLGGYYVVLFNIHHIVMDGSSLDRFITDINCLLAGEKVEEETIDKYLHQLSLESPLRDDYFDDEFSTYLSNIECIGNEVDFSIENNQQDVFHYSETLPSDLSIKIDFFIKQFQISKFNLFLLTYGVFLAKLFNQEKMLVDYPVNIRTNKEINGCFLNVVTLPLHFTGEYSFFTLICKWKELLPILKRATRYKFDNKSSLGRIPIFSSLTMSQLQDLCVNKKTYKAKSYPQITHANISIKYREQNEKFYFVCDVLANLFPEYFSSSLLQRFFNYFKKLLENPNTQLNMLDLTFAEEKKYLLYDLNETGVVFPKNETLFSLFDEQAKMTPYNTAVVDVVKTKTYKELLLDSNLFSKYIWQRVRETTRTPKPIAILSEKGYNQVVGTLAIIKTGHSYLPLSINWPVNRVEEILEQGEVSILLISRYEYGHKNILKSLSKKYIILIIEDVLDKIYQDKKLHDELQLIELPNVKETDIAYVIFTSGSTGKPKGVTINHKGAINTIYAINSKFNVTCKDKILALSELSFDLSVYDIFGLLSVGGCIVFPKQSAVKEPKHWLDLVCKHNITLWNTVPQLADLLIDQIKNSGSDVLRLRLFLLSGDWIPTQLPNKIKKEFQKAKIISLGGATEGSIWSIWYDVIAVNPEWNKIPYGVAMPNQKMYVLDHTGCPSPLGIIGEIYIGGVGVALNYYNDEEKTKASFIDHQLLGRIYKTGDLGRWHKDGYIEFMGRKDDQVKINGYRVELEEISANLKRVEGVQDAVSIIYVQNRISYIISYYTGKKLKEDKVINFLKSFLPSYMMPSMIIHVAKFPLTSNGKLDKKSLLNPKFINEDLYVSPNNIQEQLICDAFAFVLGLDKASVNDDFFKLGGNSIKAIRLVTHLQKNFDVTITDIFNFKNPRELSKNIHFEKNFLHTKLKEVKAFYQYKNNDQFFDLPIHKKLDHYLQTLNNIPALYTAKSIKNVLLTGSTGFLGCNLLNQLLRLTNYHITLLVRAKSNKDAFIRVNKIFKFYFDDSLGKLYRNRITVFASDIEKNDLGLSSADYNSLIKNIDSIIHAAAFVKHYGEINQFYSANVKTTIHLLKLCEMTQLKDFHYISTISVSSEQSFFTEDDLGVVSKKETANKYITTKLEGENEVLQSRQRGIKGNIYRIGNLAFILSNGLAQKNKEDNRFFNQIKCFINFGIITEALSIEEISPVDLTAKAIIKLFDKKELINEIFHVVNPHLCNIAEIFYKNTKTLVKNVSIDEFIDKIIIFLENPATQSQAERFLLHQGWLDAGNQYAQAQIFQNRTQSILKHLNFEWCPITYENFLWYLKKNNVSIQVGQK